MMISLDLTKSQEVRKAGDRSNSIHTNIKIGIFANNERPKVFFRVNV